MDVLKLSIDTRDDLDVRRAVRMLHLVTAAWNARHHLACDNSYQDQNIDLRLAGIYVNRQYEYLLAELYPRCKVRCDADRIMDWYGPRMQRQLCTWSHSGDGPR